jgi:outer membrane murein-binding lipoprotein Lpp
LTATVQTLAADVQTLAADVQTLAADVQTLAADVQSLRAEVKDLQSRVGQLERTVNERSFETKPIWERALAEIADIRIEMREGFHEVGVKIDILVRDLFSMRSDHERLERRVSRIESNQA